MSFRGSVLEDIGGFDEGFGRRGEGRAHFEDTDVSHRVKRAGYDLVYTPAAPVVHDHGFRGSDSYHEWRLRNWLRLYRRVDHGTLDAVDFLWRYLARCGYFSVQARRPLVGNVLSLLSGQPPVENSVRER
jgi:GT2 family glycosyltransferase